MVLVMVVMLFMMLVMVFLMKRSTTRITPTKHKEQRTKAVVKIT